MNRTIGLSPKVWAPVAAQVIALLANLIATGSFDRAELAQVVALALTALVGYFAGPGEIEPYEGWDAIPGGAAEEAKAEPISGQGSP